MSVLGGVVELEPSRVVAEFVDADRQDVQHPAGRLRAAGGGLNVEIRLRDVVDTKRMRRF